MNDNMPFPLAATLNLFREPDGTHEITVSSADPLIMMEAPEDLSPIDHIENLIIDAALRMKERKLSDGTYREPGV